MAKIECWGEVIGGWSIYWVSTVEILVSSLSHAPHFVARPEMIILLPEAAFNNLVALFCSELSSLTGSQ